MWGLTNIHHAPLCKRKHIPRGIATSLFIENCTYTQTGSRAHINVLRLRGAIVQLHNPTFQHFTILTGRDSVQRLLGSTDVGASAS